MSLPDYTLFFDRHHTPENSDHYHGSSVANRHEICHDRSRLLTVLSDYWDDTCIEIMQDRFGWRQRLSLPGDLRNLCAHCLLYCVEHIIHRQLDYPQHQDVALHGDCAKAARILRKLLEGGGSSQGSGSPECVSDTAADGASEVTGGEPDSVDISSVGSLKHDRNMTSETTVAEAEEEADVVKYYTPVAGKESEDDMSLPPAHGRLMERFLARRRSRSIPDGGAGPHWPLGPVFYYWRLDDAIKAVDETDASFWRLDDAIVQFRDELHAYRDQTA